MTGSNRPPLGSTSTTGPLRDPFGLVDQVLDEQFRIDKFVGEGGFSLVYKGLHLGLEEPIALKCLKLPAVKGSAVVDSFVRRFREESRLHYRLSQGSLYITRTIASGTTLAPSTGTLVPYMVLEWLEGRSLAADFEVRRAYGDKGRGLDKMVALLDTAVDALAFAHSLGVAHRDVNPGNIFLAETREGVRAKILDFGVAKVIDDEQLALGPRAQTLGAMRIFSPGYGAPEQFDSNIGPAGPWTDVYSLALILLEGMRDQAIRQGDNLGQFQEQALNRSQRPTPWRLGLDVPPAVEEVFVDALQLEPRLRFQDAGEFWGRLKNAMRAVQKEVPPSTMRDIAPPSLTPAPVPLSLPAHLSHPHMPPKTQPIPILSNPPGAPGHASPGPMPTAPPMSPHPLPVPGSSPHSPSQIPQLAPHFPPASSQRPHAQPGYPSPMPPPPPATMPFSPNQSQGAMHPQFPPTSLGPSSDEIVTHDGLGLGLGHSEEGGGGGGHAFRIVAIIITLILAAVVGVIVWQLWIRFG